MLTPAEELGLSGITLANQVRKAFEALPESEVLAILGRIRDEAFRRHLVYFRDGEREAIRVLPWPVTVLPDQLAYLHSVSLTILNALKRLPRLYFEDPEIHELLRLPPEEEEWLRACSGPAQNENDPVFGRLDAMLDVTSPTWKSSLLFVEPNLSGVGGLHLVPTCDQIVGDVVVPALLSRDRWLHLDLGQDIRELLMQEILDHLEALHRPARNVCFVEPKYAKTGPDEQEDLAQFYHDRYGLKVMHADPSELTLDRGEVYYDGDVVELAYRDYEIRDLIALGRGGVDIEPLRTLFLQNRVVSSITAELDQKSCFEVLTDPRIAPRYFHPDERQVFRRHILWTRLVSDRRTTLPGGEEGGLLEFARRERESLVLKPNRAYGGTGVVIGPSVSESEWDAAIEQALADAERWVFQQLANIPVRNFPVAGPDGAVRLEPFHCVFGFAPSKYGLAVLGRASQKQVVNVAQRGGMFAVMVAHEHEPFDGPVPTP